MIAIMIPQSRYVVAAATAINEITRTIRTVCIATSILLNKFYIKIKIILYLYSTSVSKSQ